MTAIDSSPAPGLAGAPPIGRLVVINDVASARGGATGLALQSIRLMRGLGVPVTFVVGDAGGGNPEMEELGVEVVGLGGRHVATGGRVNALANGLYNRQARAGLADWIAARDDARTVYHLHGWSKVLSPSVFDALRPVAKRLVLHAHDFFLACPNGAFQDYNRGETCLRVPLGADCLSTNCDKRSYPQKLWRAARHGALKLAAARGFAETPVLMIHGGMRSWFERSGFAAERLRTVLNPVEPFTGGRIEAERNRVFYFVGRVEAEKGVFEAAEAARRAGVTLRVIGDGPDRAELSARHPDLEIAGWRSREAIGGMLADARALVMPSRYPEPFGLVAAEASRSGLPIAVSASALLAPDIEGAGLGLACDPRDADGFAGTLRRLADMPHDEIQAMSERAFAGTAPIASSLADWGNALASIYEERLMDVPHDAAGHKPGGRGAAPRVRLFNVKYSPNLGDGLLSEALERALSETGCDPEGTWSVDMAARGEYGPGSASRSLALRTLAAIPPPIRKVAVRVPLELAARRRWRPHYEARLAGADAVVIGGGNLFTDMDLNFPYKMTTALRVAAARRLPVAIYAVGVSAKWSNAGIAMMREALANSALCHVSVRDAASKSAFDRLFAAAARREAEIVRDPGLLVSRYAPRGAGRAGGAPPPPIGLCITSAVAIRYHSAFEVTDAGLSEWYVRFAGRIAAAGHPLLAFTNGSPEDERFFDDIEGRLAQAATGGFERGRPKTPSELGSIASNLRALAAHRMHALIAAYSYATPIFALRWDAKVDAFMDSVGAGGRIAVATPGTEAEVSDGVLALLEDGTDPARLGRETVLEEALDGVRRLKAAIDAALVSGPAKG